MVADRSNVIVAGSVPMGVDKVFSVLVAAVCVAMLVRMMLGDRRRQRWDSAFIKAWFRLRRQALAIWHWRRKRHAAAQARVTAQEAINRARNKVGAKVDKDGNVYTPEAFKGPRKPH
jgi:hypothetical protein